MLIDIKKVHPNPYRDFDLYPFDEEQIENLMLSFSDNGDFGILPARPNGTPGTYQIACGHHRVEAMRRLDFSMVDLKVGDYDDDQMVRIMVDENAKQMGQNSAAIIDSVSAAVRRIAYVTLTMDWESVPEFWHTLYESRASFGKALQNMETGDGIGWRLVERYLDRRLTKSKIESALATIKSSNLQLGLVKKVRERIDSERKEFERIAEEARQEQERQARAAAEAEEQGRKEAEAWQRKLEKMERDKQAAQKAADEAKQKRDREIAELRQKELAARQKAEVEQRKAEEELRRKRQAEAVKMAEEMQRNRAAADEQAKRQKEASERAIRAMENTEENNSKIQTKFDTKIASLFKNDYQLTVFRESVTSVDMAKVLPESRQYELAQACIAWHKRNMPKGLDQMTAKSISGWLDMELSSFLNFERKSTREEEARAIRSNLDRSIDQDYKDVSDAFAKIGTGLARLNEKYGRYPKDHTPPKPSSEFLQRLPKAISDLERLRDRLAKL